MSAPVLSFMSTLAPSDLGGERGAEQRGALETCAELISTEPGNRAHVVIGLYLNVHIHPFVSVLAWSRPACLNWTWFYFVPKYPTTQLLLLPRL